MLDGGYQYTADCENLCTDVLIKHTGNEFETYNGNFFSSHCKKKIHINLVCSKQF